MSNIACIITSYNNLPYLEQAVGSVLAQSVRPDEVIVTDDCSTDGSRDFLKNLARDYKELKLILRENNVGVAINRDEAIRSASSEYITTLDGDDIYYPGKIEAELGMLRDSSRAVVFSGISQVDAAGGIIRELGEAGQFSCVDNGIGISQLDRLERIRYVLYRMGPLPRDMMFSRKLYEQSNGIRHDLELYEDWDLKIRLACNTDTWIFSGVTGIGYRVHDEGLSSARNPTEDKGLTHLVWQLNVIGGNRKLIRDIFGREEVYKALMMRIVKTAGFKGFQLIR